MPEHPVMQALVSDDRDRFLAAEARSRRAGGWPPFGRLAAIILSGPDAGSADRAARDFAKAAPHLDGRRGAGSRARAAWNGCAAGTGGAFWSRRRATPISRRCCATGWRGPSRPPPSASRWTSIPTASCDLSGCIVAAFCPGRPGCAAHIPMLEPARFPGGAARGFRATITCREAHRGWGCPGRSRPWPIGN